MIVCDTGPLVAVADRDDQDNRACTDLLTGLHLARRAILVPAPVIAEVGHLLARTGGAKIEAAFLRSSSRRPSRSSTGGQAAWAQRIAPPEDGAHAQVRRRATYRIRATRRDRTPQRSALAS